jgi:hypothetical protein
MVNHQHRRSIVHRKVLITFLLIVIVVSACGTPPTPTGLPAETPTSSFALPNILIEAAGEVELRRSGWNDFLPVSAGVAVRPGDMLRVSSGSDAAVFCGEEILWDEGPNTLPADGVEHGVPCQTGRPPRPWSDVAALRGEEKQQIPYIISPRNTALINDRPALRWHALSGTDSYTVSLISEDGQDREPVQVNTNESAWPEGWQPLTPGANNILIVEGGEKRSDEGNTTHTGLGFWLLETDESQDINAQERHLRDRPISTNAADLLVAELYLSYGLRAEAAELLLKLVESDGTPAVRLALGRVYLEMGVSAEAEASFQQALAAAEEAGELEMKAAALVGLGLTARQTKEEALAEEHLQEARTIYEQIGDQSGIDEVTQLLSK